MHRLVLALAGNIAAAVTTALPLDMLQSLTLLTSSTSSASCIAVRMTNNRFLTSASCAIDALDSVRFLAAGGTLQLSPEAPIAISSVTSLWSDAMTQVLAIDSLPPSLQLRLPGNVSLPSRLSNSTDASIVEIDLDSGEVGVTRRVIFVDSSLCVPRPTNDDQLPPSVCVLPLKVNDRGESTMIGPRIQRFLIQHDTSNDLHILLGLSLPIDTRQETDGFRLFTWLHASLSDETFAGLWDDDDKAIFSDRILGDTVDMIDRHAEFIAAVRQHQRTDTICSGSLIAPRFVLTAGHCADGYTLRYVAIGSREKTGAGGEILSVSKRYRPIKYSGETKTHDFMVLQLARASSRTPIRLLGDENSMIGKRATVLGYGAMSADGSVESTTLRSAEIPVGPANDECSALLQIDMDDTMLCAGGEPDRGACYGDSGGPLMLEPGTDAQRLIAIVSRGVACGSDGIPHVYARVASMVPFLTRWTEDTALIDG